MKLHVTRALAFTKPQEEIQNSPSEESTPLRAPEMRSALKEIPCHSDSWASLESRCITFGHSLQPAWSCSVSLNLKHEGAHEIFIVWRKLWSPARGCMAESRLRHDERAAIQVASDEAGDLLRKEAASTFNGILGGHTEELSTLSGCWRLACSAQESRREARVVIS
ncbi:hypothetical protein NPIL_271901 [Nephila pilipes]|uniref:Uncharacterized protein n=1 Tax=Nephila pilipes TaxID=299642 RepID=A0A8X6P3P3_NEPPI|nr:hypothetical protein NPIL_271901 [Nephila pilipes]